MGRMRGVRIERIENGWSAASAGRRSGAIVRAILAECPPVATRRCSTSPSDSTRRSSGRISCAWTRGSSRGRSACSSPPYGRACAPRSRTSGRWPRRSCASPPLLSCPRVRGVEVGEEPIGARQSTCPAARAPYPSTVVMGAVTARAAGVEEIVVCAPPGPGGRAHPVILAACVLCEVNEVYRMGGAQAIAALAYGRNGQARGCDRRPRQPLGPRRLCGRILGRRSASTVWPGPASWWWWLPLGAPGWS